MRGWDYQLVRVYRDGRPSETLIVSVTSDARPDGLSPEEDALHRMLCSNMTFTELAAGLKLAEDDARHRVQSYLEKLAVLRHMYS